MITPAEWIQARIDKTCLSIEDSLTAPGVEFPITVYLPGDNPRDVEVAQGAVQNLVINGWNAKLDGMPASGPGFSAHMSIRITLPEGPLHAHDAPAAAAGWDALRERCAWFENLYARFVDAPKVGSNITGMRFGKVDRQLNEIDDLRAELKDTRGDMETAREELAASLGLEPSNGRSFVAWEQIQKAVDTLVAQGKPDPELVRRRAWFEELGRHITRDSEVKIGDPLLGARVTIQKLRRNTAISAAELNAYEVKRLQSILSESAPALAQLDDLADHILSEFGRHDVDQAAYSAPDVGTAPNEAIRLLTLAKQRGAFARNPLLFGEWDDPRATIKSLAARLDSAHKELEDLDAIGDYLENFEKRSLDDEVVSVMETVSGLSGVVTGLLDLAIKRDAFPEEDEDDFEDIQGQLRNDSSTRIEGGGGETPIHALFASAFAELRRVIGEGTPPRA